MAEFATNGKGNLGVTLGAIGTGLSALNGGLGNILGGMPGYGGMWGGRGMYGGYADCHHGDRYLIDRYEAAQQARISELETEVKLRDANTYTLGEVGKLRDYMERKLDCLQGQINQQAVINAQITGNLSCMQGQIAELKALSKTVIPISSICPSPMLQYNSWVAPTDTAATPTTSAAA